MSEKTVTEPYYDVVYRRYDGEIKTVKIEADNIFNDKEVTNFVIDRVTAVKLTGVLEAWRVPLDPNDDR